MCGDERLVNSVTRDTVERERESLSHWLKKSATGFCVSVCLCCARVLSFTNQVCYENRGETGEWMNRLFVCVCGCVGGGRRSMAKLLLYILYARCATILSVPAVSLLTPFFYILAFFFSLEWGGFTRRKVTAG